MKLSEVLGAVIAAGFLFSCGNSPEPKSMQPAQTAPPGQKAAGKPGGPGDAAKEKKPAVDPAVAEKEIEKLAQSSDDTVVDGWFFGQEPRMLKSFYRKVPASEKAQFSVAYHQFIVSKNQNLASDFESYVPYSQRVQFARKWWSEHNPRFEKQEPKYKILWMHEAVQDAGELWWRIEEKLDPNSADSNNVIAHDQEQTMVSKFMETTQGAAGSLSDEIWKETHKK